ncbi:Phosphatidylinositol-binding clathrin assembly protein [Trichoplax sp. H2]|nr:Phosphatidylinositol-binding clathrin assembly protein [Trichoplax sp. H2]|eukprot:RDD45974.1 Phosphatidylinositol-binding clathrin assembly protein [Trichoplax sp. H2]
MSVVDRVTAARHVLTGDFISKAVCKATNHDIISPKKKHVDYLIQCTHGQNVDISVMVDTLYERTNNTSWVVVCKTLVTHHQLLCYGNERYVQHVASRTASFNLETFLDRSGNQGYEMSLFARKYAKYLNAKSYSYRMMAYDFCRVERGKDGILRKQEFAKLLGLDTLQLSKTLPALEQQIDSLLGMEITVGELSNGVISNAFFLLFKDLVRLFACYNDAMINLLEKYFDLSKKSCKDALEFYKKFVVTMEKVKEFWKIAEDRGYDKGDIPYLNSAPASLLEALENHFYGLDKKGAKGKASTEEIEKAKAEIQNMEILKQRAYSLNVAPGSATANQAKPQTPQQQPNLISPNSPQPTPTEKTPSFDTFEPFNNAPAEQPKQQRTAFDPFNSNSQPQPTVASPQADLFQQQPTVAKPQIDPFQSQPTVTSPQADPFQQSPMASSVSPQQPTVPKNDLTDLGGIFPSQPTGAQSGAGNSLWQSQQQPQAAPAMQFNTNFNQPTQAESFNANFNQVPQANNEPFKANFKDAPNSNSDQPLDLFAGVMQPTVLGTEKAQQIQNNDSNAQLSNDLDSSLAKAAENLTLRNTNATVPAKGSVMASKKSKHQWTPSQPQKLTGGDNYQFRPIAATTTTTWGQPGTWNQQQTAGFPQQQFTQPMAMQQPVNPLNPFQQQNMFPTQSQPQAAFQRPPLQPQDPFGL